MLLLARYGPVFFIGALLWLWLRPAGELAKLRDRLAVGRALAAAALALGLGQLIGLALRRLRPFQDHSVRLLIAPNFDPPFPSDHALAAFAITTALAATHPRLSLGLSTLATLLGVARVFVGIHYPLDILGGAILGSAIGGLIRKANVWLVPVI
jgi:undecaprenyl-diphosphatase